jgi:hypothetical protein
MNATRVNAAKKSYDEMFGDDMSVRAILIAKQVTTHSELEEFEDELTAGEYDCISWELGQ